MFRFLSKKFPGIVSAHEWRQDGPMLRECTVCNRVESFEEGSRIIDDYEGGWAINKLGNLFSHFKRKNNN